ncbi:hypothetical protein FQA39_LY04427 [Lamprigera yunnana]|nr:hypothetical protein FQA39_LY04427 [Lamprigera yunnana]
MILLELQEKQYFMKKSDQYLRYVRDELTKGRNIEDVIKEVQLQQEHSPHLTNEINSGKVLKSVMEESRRILKQTRWISRSRTKQRLYTTPTRLWIDESATDKQDEKKEPFLKRLKKILYGDRDSPSAIDKDEKSVSEKENDEMYPGG